MVVIVIIVVIVALEYLSVSVSASITMVHCPSVSMLLYSTDLKPFVCRCGRVQVLFRERCRTDV